jgi:hypothetical protein
VENGHAPFLVGIVAVSVIMLCIIYTYKPSILHALIFTH